jgi:hypothetical protein
MRGIPLNTASSLFWNAAYLAFKTNVPFIVEHKGRKWEVVDFPGDELEIRSILPGPFGVKLRDAIPAPRWVIEKEFPDLFIELPFV